MIVDSKVSANIHSHQKKTIFPFSDLHSAFQVDLNIPKLFFLIPMDILLLHGRPSPSHPTFFFFFLICIKHKTKTNKQKPKKLYTKP